MGKLIPFYVPKRKPMTVQQPQELSPVELYVTPAKDILEQALRNAASINDVLVAFRDDKGDIGFVTNLADSTESIAFTNRLLWKILKHEHDIDNGDVPPTSA